MKIGDYCYIKNCRKFGIGKIYSFEDNNNVIISFKNNMHMSSIGNVKSSPRIIDLIEVGDYVNGYKVDFTNVNNKLSYEGKCVGFYDIDGDTTLFEKDIKSIVTKEMFESMEYKVESEVNRL